MPAFWDTPIHGPWLPILVIHIRSQVKARQSQSYYATGLNFTYTPILSEPIVTLLDPPSPITTCCQLKNRKQKSGNIMKYVENSVFFKSEVETFIY